MKKILSFALAILLLLSLLVSCGQKADEPKETTPQNNESEANTDETTKANDEKAPTPTKKEWPDESQFAVFHKFEAPKGNPREIVMDYMMKMATIEWTPAEDFVIKWEGTPSFSPNMALDFTAGKTYTGTTYGCTHVSLELFEQYLNEQNEFKCDNYSYENIVGNNCSTTMTLSYQQIIDLPISVLKPVTDRLGLLSLANGLKIPEGKGDKWYSADVFQENGQQSVYDAYATLESGDILYKSIPGTGHTRMVRSVEIYKNAAGKILPSKSYVYVIESTNEWFNDEKNTLWYIDKKYSFSELYKGEFMPVTLDIFHEENPTYDDAYIALDTELTESLIKKSVLKGTVSSNFPLNYIQITIKDADGKIIDRELKAGLTDSYKYDLRKFYIDTKEYTAGTYTLTVRAGIARGGVDLQNLTFTID
ncbi:MAG: hypothetical protein IKU45_04105 [Clostridia bacterium]|nr:hypothetical protein [Clostridia bacterium]